MKLMNPFYTQLTFHTIHLLLDCAQLLDELAHRLELELKLIHDQLQLARAGAPIRMIACAIARFAISMDQHNSRTRDRDQKSVSVWSTCGNVRGASTNEINRPAGHMHAYARVIAIGGRTRRFYNLMYRSDRACAEQKEERTEGDRDGVEDRELTGRRHTHDQHELVLACASLCHLSCLSRDRSMHTGTDLRLRMTEQACKLSVALPSATMDRLLPVDRE